jgi:hypothetical protein
MFLTGGMGTGIEKATSAVQEGKSPGSPAGIARSVPANSLLGRRSMAFLFHDFRVLCHPMHVVCTCICSRPSAQD